MVLLRVKVESWVLDVSFTLFLLCRPDNKVKLELPSGGVRRVKPSRETLGGTLSEPRRKTVSTWQRLARPLIRLFPRIPKKLEAEEVWKGLCHCLCHP